VTPAVLSLYEEALSNFDVLTLRMSGGSLVPFDVPRWCSPPDSADESVLRRCQGPVLDVGCGPGRFVVALGERGVPSLGVDISRTAVAHARQAGAKAVRASVFEPLPREGGWATVLLIDGNIGIGGDPYALLRRCANVVSSTGRIIAEVEPADVDERLTARLEHADGRSGPWFRWARCGSTAMRRAAADLGLTVSEAWLCDGRSFLSLDAA
jgi:SAM-dependent methyltransferase